MLTLGAVEAIEERNRVKMADLTKNEKRALEKVIQINEEIRGYDPEYMTANVVSMLLHIAIHQPIHMQTLAESMGASQSTVSRVVSYLGSAQSRSLGLVEAAEDPTNRRRKIIRLTADGVALLSRIIKILQKAS